MKMKTTKFLAVLAVLAMAFAGFAAIAASEQNDATDGGDIGDYTSTATVVIPKGALDSSIPMTVKAQSTMSVSDDLVFTKFAYNNKVTGKGYNDNAYLGYAVVYLTMDLSGLKVGGEAITDGYIAVEQTNSALNGVVCGQDHQYKSSNSSTTMISYFANSTFGSTAEYFAILVPQDGSKVDVTVTLYSDATLTKGVGTATIKGTELTSRAFTLDFTAASTIVLLGETNMGSIGATSATTAGQWYYTAPSSNASTLTLNAFTGNVAFWENTSGTALSVELIGTSALTAYTPLKDNGNSASGVISGYDVTAGNTAAGNELTIQASDDSAAKLTMTQLNDESIGLWSDAAMTIGNESKGLTTLDVTGGSFGAFVHSNTLTINNAAVDVAGGEKGINTDTGGTLSLVKSEVNAYLTTGGVNTCGTDALWGVKSATVTTDADSVLTTQGLYAATTITPNGIIYVTGGYIQTDVGTYFGIAGLFTGATVTAYSSSSASGGVAGHLYVVDGADAYGANLTYAGKAQTVDATSAADAAAVITAIGTTALTSTDAIIQLGASGASIDLTTLMASTKLATVKNLVFYSDDNAFTLTASSDFDISNKTIAVENGTLNATLVNGSETAKVTGLTGEFTILPGSIVVVGSLSSNAVIEVDGTFELVSDIADGATVTIKAAEDAKTAIVKTISDIAIGEGASLNFQDIDLDFGGAFINSGTVSLKTDAVLASDLYVTGGSLYVADAQSYDIILDGVIVTSDLTTTADLYADSATFNKTVAVGGDMALAGTTVLIAGTSTTALNTIAVAGDATIAGNLTLNNYTKLTLNGITTVAADSTITLTGDKSTLVNKGTLTVNGKITGSKVVNDGVTVIKGSVATIDNNKTIRLYGAIATTVANEGTIVVMDANAAIAARTGTGTIDNSAVSSPSEYSGTIVTSVTPFSKNQIVTINKDTEVKKGGSITFYGEVIVPAGVTLTIEDGAYMLVSGVFSKLTNHGTIVIEGNKATTGVLNAVGGEVNNYGTINVSYSGSEASPINFVIGEATIVNNLNAITIGEGSVVKNGTVYFMNAVTGTIVVNGSINGTIINKGGVQIASESNAGLKVSNAAAGAIVDVKATHGQVTINDDNFKTTSNITGDNEVIVSIAGLVAEDTIGGFTVTQATFKDLNNDSKVTPKLIVSGIVSVSTSQTLDLDGKHGKFFVDGFVDVTDALTIDEGIKFTFKDATTFMNVSGTLTIDEDSKTFVDGGNPEIIVSGHIVSYQNELASDLKISAASYTVPKSTETARCYIYTTFADAIAEAALLEITTVSVTGNANDGSVDGIAVLKDVTVPVGMTVKVLSGNLIVADKVALVVPYNADYSTVLNLSAGAKIIVNGKLSFENMSKGFKGTDSDITSEVVLVADKAVTYTTLAWAMSDVGTEEATLTLCGDTIIKTNTTIPENITVDTNGYKFTVKDVELTIDGSLFLDSATVYDVTDKGSIVLNGTITKESKMDYDPLANEYPAGLYFSTMDAALYVIANIADAEACALIADNNKLTYNGDLKTSDIEFDAEGTLIFADTVTAKSLDIGSKAKVTFNDDVEIGLITAGVSTITFAKGIGIDTTVVSPVGTIILSETAAVETSTVTVATASDVTTMTLAGTIGNIWTADQYQIATLGDVVIKADELIDLSVGLGTTTISKNTEIYYIEVYGDLVVDNNCKLTADTALVYGTLTANAATDSKAKGTAVIENLAVGIDFKDTSAAAAVYGDVSADVVLVAADATVPETITEMSYSTEVYVELAKCLTAYASYSSEDLLDLLEGIDFDIIDPNAKGPVWYDEDGTLVLAADIGDYDAIYAEFNYNVYSVTIVTDAGVKSVALNGVEMINAVGNTFTTLSSIPAGTYKVTYTLKSGYSGTAVLSTETGTILKDNTFAISPGNEDLNLVFQLAGIEPTPEPEPEPTPTPEEKSEWTVTTILLCVLVVLIAIMAVIVALRLNRN